MWQPRIEGSVRRWVLAGTVCPVRWFPVSSSASFPTREAAFFFAMIRGVCVKQSAQRLARCYGLPCSTVPERRVGLHAQPVVRLDDGSVVYWSRRSDLNLRFLRLPAGTNFPPEAPLPLPPEPV